MQQAMTLALRSLALGSTILVCLPAAFAATDVQGVNVELDFGIGYRICEPETATPPSLDQAFMCPGRLAPLETVSVEMHQEKPANPDWKLYQGKVERTIRFKGIEAKAELLLWQAIDPQGKATAYIDGRISNNQVLGKNYFRLTAIGGFNYLQYSILYGMPVKYQSEGEFFDFAPEVVIAPKH